MFYEDKNLVIEIKGLSNNGGEARTGWIDGKTDTRELMVMIESTGDLEMDIQYRDSELVEENMGNMPMNIPASGAGNRKMYRFGGPVGHSFRLCFKNIDDNVLDFKARLQLCSM